jgi:preprotein translocase subunit SecF
MDFSGGTLIMARGFENTPSNSEVDSLENSIEHMISAEVDIRVVHDPTTGKPGLDIQTIKFIDENEESSIAFLIKGELGSFEYNVDSIGSVLTSVYQSQTVKALIAAVISMAVIIFIALRQPISVGLIILALGLNVLGVLGFMSIFGVPMTLASVAGVLLLIGYSVDTNILLSNSVLKRVGVEPRDRAAEAMKTGLMMSGTTLLVMVVLNLCTTAPQLFQLSAVLIFGIVADIFDTWFLNAGVLLRHAEKQKRSELYVSV